MNVLNLVGWDVPERGTFSLFVVLPCCGIFPIFCTIFTSSASIPVVGIFGVRDADEVGLLSSAPFAVWVVGMGFVYLHTCMDAGVCPGIAVEQYKRNFVLALPRRLSVNERDPTDQKEPFPQGIDSVPTAICFERTLGFERTAVSAKCAFSQIGSNMHSVVSPRFKACAPSIFQRDREGAVEIPSSKSFRDARSLRRKDGSTQPPKEEHLRDVEDIFAMRAAVFRTLLPHSLHSKYRCASVPL